MSLIYGINPVTEAIVSGKTINKIYAQKGNKEVYQVIQKAKEKRIVVVEADKSKLDKMITEENEKLKNSQGIVASVTEYNYFTIDDILDATSTIVKHLEKKDKKAAKMEIFNINNKKNDYMEVESGYHKSVDEIIKEIGGNNNGKKEQ